MSPLPTIYWLPDSNALLIDTKMEIKIVDVFSSDIINTIPLNQFRWTRWSANQKYLVLEDFTQSFVWDMEQQEIIAEFGVNDSSFTWLSDTDFVFFRISEENKTTKLIRYSILTKQETIITTFKHIISLSPDEDFLLLDSVSRLDIWDISEKGVVQTLDNSTFFAFNFGFRPILGTVWASTVDSIFLLTQYHGIYLWDVNEDKITRLISDIHLGRTTAVSWVHNKPILAGSGSINWYSSIDTNENIEWIQTNNGFITDIEWSFDDKYIAMISKQGTLDIYDVISKNIHNLNTRGLSNCHNRLSWSPIDNRLAWIGNDYAVHIWNLETDTEISSVIPDVTYNIGDDNTLCFNSVIWSHSGKYLFSSGSDGIVRQWNTDNLQNISEIQYLWEITDIAISYDDSYLAVAGKTSYPLAVLLINLLNDDMQRLDISISHRVTSLDV